jgi:hypothetical protein
MYKIALCLFGSIGFKEKPTNLSTDIIDPSLCFDFFKRNLLSLHDVDIFFHTWSSEYNKNISSLYNPKKSLIEKQIIIDTNLNDYSLDYIEHYDHVNNLNFKNQSPKKFYEDFVFRTKSRWHSQITSLELLKEYKIKNNIDYNFVVQSRFDLILKNRLALENLNNNIVHLVNSPNHNKTQLLDTLFVSNYNNALKFIKLKSKLNKYPICPTNLLPIFFNEEKIPFKNSFKLKENYIHRHHHKYYEITFLKKIVIFMVARILNLISFLIKSLRYLYNFFHNIIH